MSKKTRTPHLNLCAFFFPSKEWSKRGLLQLSLCTSKAINTRAVAASCFCLAGRCSDPRCSEASATANRVRGRVVPAIVLYQRRHRLEEGFRMRARGILPIRKHLDVNEDAEDLLPVTPAVDVPLDVPDRSGRCGRGKAGNTWT